MPAEYDDLKEFKKKLEKLDTDAFLKSCCKELAARLLAKTKKRTPVGIYPAGSGKVGGTLRRGWEASEVTRNGITYEIRIYNPTVYAPYVEYGHRTRGGKGWVTGRFMLTESETEIRNQAKGILAKKLKDALNDL